MANLVVEPVHDVLQLAHLIALARNAVEVEVMAYAHQSLVGSRRVRETLATRLLAGFVGWRLAEVM